MHYAQYKGSDIGMSQHFRVLVCALGRFIINAKQTLKDKISRPASTDNLLLITIIRHTVKKEKINNYFM